MKNFNDLNATAQQLVDHAIYAAITAHSFRKIKEYKMMNQYIGQKDAFLYAAAVADNAAEPEFGVMYSIYCDRFIDTRGVAQFTETH